MQSINDLDNDIDHSTNNIEIASCKNNNKHTRYKNVNEKKLYADLSKERINQ